MSRGVTRACRSSPDLLGIGLSKAFHAVLPSERVPLCHWWGTWQQKANKSIVGRAQELRAAGPKSKKIRNTDDSNHKESSSWHLCLPRLPGVRKMQRAGHALIFTPWVISFSLPHLPTPFAACLWLDLHTSCANMSGKERTPLATRTWWTEARFTDQPGSSVMSPPHGAGCHWRFNNSNEKMSDALGIKRPRPGSQHWSLLAVKPQASQSLGSLWYSVSYL